LKPAEFQYHQPGNVDQAIALLKQAGDSGKILAGGPNLMPLMNFRLAEPVYLIDINAMAGLDYIR
jgi:carbon-monoxide dehydrogenase medium subunit